MLIFLSITQVIIFGMLGASVASFLGVVFERLPKGEKITGRSHCACGRQLETVELIPIFGWLKVKGETKCCNVKLPKSYLISEIAGFIIGAGIGFLYLVLLGVI
jgi:leader peptidase (prepilin peptidase) / N-methyltransferase